MDSLLDLSHTTIALGRDGRTELIEHRSGPTPPRVEGVTIGAPFLTRDAPHGGEMHPDGDELLYVLSGSVCVELEEEGGVSLSSL